jgi:hypothetical protein
MFQLAINTVAQAHEKVECEPVVASLESKCSLAV